MLHCQTHTSSYCPLMVLGLLMLTSSSTAHCVKFTAWFHPGLADTLCPAQKTSGSIRGVWERGKTCQRRGKLVQILGQNFIFFSVMPESQTLKRRIWILIRTKRQFHPWLKILKCRHTTHKNAHTHTHTHTHTLTESFRQLLNSCPGA